VTRQIARVAGGLPILHRDPFDRMILATSMKKNWLLLTGDQVLNAYGISIDWWFRLSKFA
jgi:PIN domain nuclease of toxin-antitoxin system